MAKRVHNQGPSEHFYRMARADLERFWGRMTSDDKKYWYEYNTKGIFFRDFGRTDQLDPAALLAEIKQRMENNGEHVWFTKRMCSEWTGGKYSKLPYLVNFFLTFVNEKKKFEASMGGSAAGGSGAAAGGSGAAAGGTSPPPAMTYASATSLAPPASAVALRAPPAPAAGYPWYPPFGAAYPPPFPQHAFPPFAFPPPPPAFPPPPHGFPQPPFHPHGFPPMVFPPPPFGGYQHNGLWVAPPPPQQGQAGPARLALPPIAVPAPPPAPSAALPAPSAAVPATPAPSAAAPSAAAPSAAVPATPAPSAAAPSAAAPSAAAPSAAAPSAAAPSAAVPATPAPPPSPSAAVPATPAPPPSPPAAVPATPSPSSAVAVPGTPPPAPSVAGIAPHWAFPEPPAAVPAPSAAVPAPAADQPVWPDAASEGSMDLDSDADSACGGAGSACGGAGSACGARKPGRSKGPKDWTAAQCENYIRRAESAIKRFSDTRRRVEEEVRHENARYKRLNDAWLALEAQKRSDPRRDNEIAERERNIGWIRMRLNQASGQLRSSREALAKLNEAVKEKGLSRTYHQERARLESRIKEREASVAEHTRNLGEITKIQGEAVRPRQDISAAYTKQLEAYQSVSRLEKQLHNTDAQLEDARAKLAKWRRLREECAGAAPAASSAGPAASTASSAGPAASTASSAGPAASTASSAGPSASSGEGNQPMLELLSGVLRACRKKAEAAAAVKEAAAAAEEAAAAAERAAAAAAAPLREPRFAVQWPDSGDDAEPEFFELHETPCRGVASCGEAPGAPLKAARALSSAPTSPMRPRSLSRAMQAAADSDAAAEPEVEEGEIVEPAEAAASTAEPAASTAEAAEAAASTAEAAEAAASTAEAAEPAASAAADQDEPMQYEEETQAIDYGAAEPSAADPCAVDQCMADAETDCSDADEPETAADQRGAAADQSGSAADQPGAAAEERPEPGKDTESESEDSEVDAPLRAAPRSKSSAPPVAACSSARKPKNKKWIVHPIVSVKSLDLNWRERERWTPSEMFMGCFSQFCKCCHCKADRSGSRSDVLFLGCSRAYGRLPTIAPGPKRQLLGGVLGAVSKAVGLLAKRAWNDFSERVANCMGDEKNIAQIASFVDCGREHVMKKINPALDKKRAACSMVPVSKISLVPAHCTQCERYNHRCKMCFFSVMEEPDNALLLYVLLKSGQDHVLQFSWLDLAAAVGSAFGGKREETHEIWKRHFDAFAGKYGLVAVENHRYSKLSAALPGAAGSSSEDASAAADLLALSRSDAGSAAPAAGGAGGSAASAAEGQGFSAADHDDYWAYHEDNYQDPYEEDYLESFDAEDDAKDSDYVPDESDEEKSSDGEESCSGAEESCSGAEDSPVLSRRPSVVPCAVSREGAVDFAAVAESAEAVQAAESAEAVQAAESAEAVQAAESAEAVQAAESAEAVQAAEPESASAVQAEPVSSAAGAGSAMEVEVEPAAAEPSTGEGRGMKRKREEDVGELEALREELEVTREMMRKLREEVLVAKEGEMAAKQGEMAAQQREMAARESCVSIREENAKLHGDMAKLQAEAARLREDLARANEAIAGTYIKRRRLERTDVNSWDNDEAEEGGA